MENLPQADVLTNLQMYFIAVLSSAIAAVGVLFINAKDAPPPFWKIFGAVTFHGSIGGAIGFTAFATGGREFWKLVFFSAGVGGGYIKVEEYFNSRRKAGDASRKRD